MCRTLILLLLILLLFSSASAETLSGKVSWIYDGDTIKVDGVGKVRLIGIDTPEKKDSSRDDYYFRHDKIPSPVLRKIANQAFLFNKEQVKNRKVKLTFAKEKADSHGRTLAYVFLPDGRMLNQLLIEKGLASVYRRFNFEHKEDFLRAEQSARNQNLGLWHK